MKEVVQRVAIVVGRTNVGLNFTDIV